MAPEDKRVAAVATMAARLVAEVYDSPSQDKQQEVASIFAVALGLLNEPRPAEPGIPTERRP